MRLTAKQVDYMELKGAHKDADCDKVYVVGGISKELGCCNAFKPRDSKVDELRCGECRFMRDS